MSGAIHPADLAHCRQAIRSGSLSFHTASRVLPASIRDPALALYAFCRLVDDEVDEGRDKAAAVLALSERLDRVYAMAPRDAPEDRAFCAIVAQHRMPRALPEALLEGLAWDAAERRYDDFSGLCAYSARVASAVGAMMCVLMGVRDRHALARACDLGVAMQLTNIARDVGEDAAAGRLYLPLDWMEEAGLSAEAFLADPRASPELRVLVARLLAEARRLYLRAQSGVPRLPPGARVGIYAARFIYAAIGGALRRQGFDPITARASTGRLRKAALLGKSAGYAAGSFVMPQPATLYAPPLAETAFLVDAVAERDGTAPFWGAGRAGSVLRALAELRSRDPVAGQEGRRA
ncbi:phytoene/squalene synthase family protein [Marivita sp. GX14005]|uniref:phytoene/squalene synthase family protein n=1 Tax=Marivita sp. GX14005 TaxID=2942276 RepID=UPI0020193F10|nr:phytoene/squalene synthase family protein [Marivita sp. GX14005]MCL3883093.1 phytoene/squalene synthase family protein [Marivita sp. GX14005]